jgi:xanthine dehydrogenase large subunit
MGGGFGGKETQMSLYACLAALLAHKTGRAVKLRLDRDDDMRATAAYRRAVLGNLLRRFFLETSDTSRAPLRVESPLVAAGE